MVSICVVCFMSVLVIHGHTIWLILPHVIEFILTFTTFLRTNWFKPFYFPEIYYPLANEVTKGYSNATFRPSFRNVLVNTLESTSFNGFWLGTDLFFKRIWNPIDFQGQRSRSSGQIFRQGDMPRFALLLFFLGFHMLV